MLPLKKTLPSGAVLEIQKASFVISNKLFKSLIKVLKGVDFSNFDLEKLNFNADLEGADINVLKNVFSELISSDELEACLKDCCKTVLWNDSRVNDELFDENEQAIGDYLIIMWEVLVFNLTPFFKSLDLRFLKASKNLKVPV